MAGYWEKAIARILNKHSISQYFEDWHHKVVSFTVGPEHAVEIPLEATMSLCKLLGTTNLMVTAKGDGRYSSHDNPYYATMNFQFFQVGFPECPQ